MLILPLAVAAYLFGSIPMGFLLVRLTTGKDVRQVGSGRTGGTNAMRAAGFGVGLATAVFDIFKATGAVWLASAVLPAEQRAWGMILCGLAAILGHNYPLFLKFKGGAGGATCVGGALGLWPWSVLIIVPLGVFVLYFVGYASLATLTAALATIAVFAYFGLFRPTAGVDPLFIWYGVGSLVLLAWALRPNIRRLIKGEERVVGYRARKTKDE